MKRRRLLLAIVLLLLVPALVFGAYKGYWQMKGFPPDVDRTMLAAGAKPEDFPEHPGKVKFYDGDTLVGTEDAETMPDRGFVYRRDLNGRLYGRTPILKFVKTGRLIVAYGPDDKELRYTDLNEGF